MRLYRKKLKNVAYNLKKLNAKIYLSLSKLCIKFVLQLYKSVSTLKINLKICVERQGTFYNSTPKIWQNINLKKSV